MAVRGIFASHSGLVGDARGGDFAGRIIMNGYGGMVPMLALSSGMPKEAVTSTTYSWVEDSHISGNAKAVGALSDSATSLVVDDSNIWTPNSIVLVESTGEHLFVTAINGNTITVTRGFSGTVAMAIADQARIQLISTAFAEATTGAQPVMQVGESRSNYVQIFKSAWSVSNTAKAMKFTTGNKVAESRQGATTYLSEQLERAFMFGRPSVSTMNNGGKVQEVRTSGGIEYAIQTYGGLYENAADNGTPGRLNLNTLSNFLRRLFDRQVKGLPNERITFTGSHVLELIQQMVMDIGEYTISTEENSYGIEVVTLTTFNGKVKLMTHPMFVENLTWNSQLWVLHPGLIRRKVLRDLEILDFDGNNQHNALDAQEGHLRTELGFEVKGTATMGILSDIQTAGGVAALPTT